MKNFVLFTLFLHWPTLLLANERLKAFSFFPAGSLLTSVNASYFSDEREFEKNKLVLEEMETVGFALQVKADWFVTNDWLLSAKIEAPISVYYQENHQGELSYLSNQRKRVHGVREPAFLIRKKIKNRIHPLFEHGLGASYAPSLFPANQGNFARGAHEFELHYWWSYHRKSFEVSGKIYTRVTAQKKIRRTTGDFEIAESYSEAGLQLIPAWHIGKKTALRGLIGLGHTTDYNTKNNNITRLSDKGFVTYLGATFLYDFRKIIASISLYSQSYVFNSIDQDRSRDTEFEFENKVASLQLTWINL